MLQGEDSTPRTRRVAPTSRASALPIPAGGEGRSNEAGSSVDAVGAAARVGSAVCGFGQRVYEEQLALSHENGWATNARLLALWWRWCVEGDAGAADELFESVRPPVVRKLESMLRDPDAADTVTQQVLLTVLEKRAQFRAESSVIAWVQAIALNKGREHLRRERRRREVDLDHAAGVAAPDNDEAAQASALAETLADLARALPPDDLDLLRMHAEGRTYAEIAAHLGIPPGTVATKLHRARQRLLSRASPRPP